MRPMDDSTKKIIDDAITKFESDFFDSWSEDSQLAISYYNGCLFGNEEENKSKWVSLDVAEVIDSLVVQMMDVFLQNDIVSIAPRRPDSQKMASQMEAYINYSILTRNDGYQTLNNLIKDGLLQRIGVIKAVWREDEKVQRTPSQFIDPNIEALLEADDNVVEIEFDEEKGTSRILHKSTNAYASSEAIAPENFIFDVDAETLKDASYVGEKAVYTEAQFRAEFNDISDEVIERALDFNAKSSEQQLRDDAGRADNQYSSKTITVYELYIRHDFDGDGVAELRFIQFINDEDKTIIEDDIVNTHPYSVFTPIKQPHKIVGMSIYDKVGDIQLLNSTIMRQSLDNLYKTNNARPLYTSGANAEDVNDNRPGAPIRVQSAADFMYVSPPSILGNSLQLLSVVDDTLSRRTGYSSNLAQIDPENMNLSGRALSEVQSMAQIKLKAYVRNVAETIKDHAKKLIELAQTHLPNGDYIPLANGVIDHITPSEWDDQYDIVVSVGLGTGDKLVEFERLNKAREVIANLIQLQGGPSGVFVKPENIIAFAKASLEKLDIENASRFLVDPDTLSPDEIQQYLDSIGGEGAAPDPALIISQNNLAIEQAKSQAAQAQAQASILRTETDAQLEMQKLQLQRDIKTAELQLEEYKLQQKDRELEIAAAKAGATINKSDAGVEVALNKEARETAKTEMDLAGQQMDITKPEGENRV
jgi:hypothetical protein